MPPRRRRRAPAKPQSQPDPQQQESPAADAPLEERLAWDSHQESTAPETPPQSLHSPSSMPGECTKFWSMIDASCKHVIWPGCL